MGLAFLGDLARKRSPAAAALLFLVLVDEIEGLVFLALAGLAHRVDLFVPAQDVLFPAVVLVAGLVSLARNWRRRANAVVPEPEPMEMLDVTTLVARIGQPLRAVPATGRGAAISLYGLSNVRTSRSGSPTESR